MTVGLAVDVLAFVALCFTSWVVADALLWMWRSRDDE